MSTRGMWGYVINGEEKFTYNHFGFVPVLARRASARFQLG